MKGQHYIPDFGKKFRIAMHSSSFTGGENDILNLLGVQKDYFGRLKSGHRAVSDKILVQLSKAFNINHALWHSNIELFGRSLGLSRREISTIAQVTLPGIDFVSRIKDDDQINSLFELVEGYWESYYFSVSNKQRLAVSRDLLIVRRKNEDNFIECEIVDGHFKYIGYCFPVWNQLYFILEKYQILNEMIVYCVNRPDRYTPVLYGVILCVSGGVEKSMDAYPSSARVAFRYLGKSCAEVMRNCCEEVKPHIDENEENLESKLLKVIPKYIFPEEVEDASIIELLNRIRNDITSDQIPLALRMET
jgi:hypothetical protein